MNQIEETAISYGLIFDIKHFAIHDGPGIRTTIFFKGCPLNCWWCHNPESRNKEIEFTASNPGKLLTGKNSNLKTIGRHITVTEVMNDILKDNIFYEESDGGVTFSGGEPLDQPGFLIELLRACKAAGIHTAVDTSGYAERTVFKQLKGLVDLYLYDIKIINPANHKRDIGYTNELILNNLDFLIGQKEKIQIRIPLIPGKTDTAENLQAIAKHIKLLGDNIEAALLPFNQLARDKYHRFQINNRMVNMKTQTPQELDIMGKYFYSRNIPYTLGG